MSKKPSTPQRQGAFVDLCEASELLGWEVRVYDGPTIAVCTPGTDDNYSRNVQQGESFDRCAQIILDGLRRSKVLPQSTT